MGIKAMEEINALEGPEECKNFIQSDKFWTFVNNNDKITITFALKRIITQLGIDFIAQQFDKCFKEKPELSFKLLSCLFNIEELAVDLFCSNSFLEEAMDSIDYESHQYQMNFCDLIAEAAGRSTCHLSIQTHCLPYLKKSLSTNLRNLAFLALSKLNFSEKESFFMESNLFDYSIELFLSDDSTQSEIGLEAMVYLASLSVMKNKISQDKKVFAHLLEFTRSNSVLNYGVSALMLKLVEFPTKEEAELSKLRALANQMVSTENSKDIENRIITMMENGKLAIGILNNLLKNMQKRENTTSSKDQTLLNVAKSFLSISFVQRFRVIVAQNGGVSTLCALAEVPNEAIRNISCYAICRLCASLDPSIIFFNQKYLDFVIPFLNFLNDESELKQFESLLALTNLESIQDSMIYDKIISHEGIKRFYDLLFSNNERIRCAAAEALCNLFSYEKAAVMFYEKKFELKIFVALCDATDGNTRRAASGILATLTFYPLFCDLLLNSDRILEVAISLINEKGNEQYEELLHRALQIIANLKENCPDQKPRIDKSLKNVPLNITTTNQAILDLQNQIKM